MPTRTTPLRTRSQVYLSTLWRFRGLTTQLEVLCQRYCPAKVEDLEMIVEEVEEGLLRHYISDKARILHIAEEQVIVRHRLGKCNTYQTKGKK